MHSRESVAEVLALRAAGLGARRIADRTGIPLATVRDWLAGRLPRHSDVQPICTACGHPAHRFDQLPPEYVYLLGIYLGDGTISEHRRSVFRLRIFLDLTYPGIIEECESALRAVMPRSRVGARERVSPYSPQDPASYLELSSFSKAWPCLLPQHGPGRKHLRTIELVDWQRKLVERDPRRLLRGLIHSDGSRFTNTGRSWANPRYSFTNRSDDIRRIFCQACELIGVRYTEAPQKVYVSRKQDVARLDEFIGPKA